MLGPIIDLLYTMSLTLGVGASTFALVLYIRALEDGVIDASEKRFLQTVYAVLRIGMAGIFFTLSWSVMFGVSIVPNVTIALLLVGIITVNAVMMTYRLMPMRFGPVIAGGSWYSLFITTQFSFANVPVLYLGGMYLLFLCFVYVVFHLAKNKYTNTSSTVGFRGEVVSTQKIREIYAHDASNFKILPQAVYYPKDTADIQSLVRMCTEYNAHNSASTSLTVRAGGTCMSGGPLNSGWIVDMTKHMSSIDIDPKAQTATVQMGAFFRDIEDAAAQYNLMFAPYPSSRRVCGIGGMLGNNASGEKSLRCGATSDNVLELEVVLADGSVERVSSKPVRGLSDPREKTLLELHKKYAEKLRTATGEVKKAASGYRLEKLVHDKEFSTVPLFVGAQGTLGIITKAVLKLTPIPQHTELLLISGQSLKDISKIIGKVFEHNPEGLETFDIHTFEKALEYLPIPAGKVLPYVDKKAHLFILAQFSEPTAPKTLAQAQKCLAALQKNGYFVQHITNPDDVAAVWEVRRNSFLLMRDHNEANYRAVPCIEDVIVPLGRLDTFITELRKILKKHDVHYGYHGHIGDGSLRIIPVFDFSSPQVSEKIVALTQEVFALIKRLKGNMSADHSDGIIRSPFLKEFYGEELYDVFGQVKQLYDPQNIMNPHKKVGGSLELLNKYLDR
jgi:FAD/FMN-containing dehydrogenase